MAIGNYALGTMPLGMASTIIVPGVAQAPLVAVGDASTYTTVSLIPHGVGLPALDIPLRAQQFAYSAPDGFSWKDDKGLQVMGARSGGKSAPTIKQLVDAALAKGGDQKSVRIAVKELARAHRAGNPEAITEFARMLDAGEFAFLALDARSEQDYYLLLKEVPLQLWWVEVLHLNLAHGYKVAAAQRLCAAFVKEHFELVPLFAERASFTGFDWVSKDGVRDGKEARDILLEVIDADQGEPKNGVVARFLEYIAENHPEEDVERQLATLQKLAYFLPGKVIPALAKELDKGNVPAAKVLVALARQDAAQVGRYFRMQLEETERVQWLARTALMRGNLEALTNDANDGKRESAKVLMDIVANWPTFARSRNELIGDAVSARRSKRNEWQNFVHVVFDEATNGYPAAFEVIKVWIEILRHEHKAKRQFVQFLIRLTIDEQSSLAAEALHDLYDEHLIVPVDLHKSRLDKLTGSIAPDIRKLAELVRQLKG